jgi:hypothetical protein
MNDTALLKTNLETEVAVIVESWLAPGVPLALTPAKMRKFAEELNKAARMIGSPNRYRYVKRSDAEFFGYKIERRQFCGDLRQFRP